MFTIRARRIASVGLATIGTVFVAVGCLFSGIAAAAGSKPFTTMQSGFTQELYGIGSNFFGGVAFASDGDPWVDPCGGSTLTRFDSQTNAPAQHGTTTLHPATTVTTTVGCGLTNAANGDMYTNTGSGVVRLDRNTGAKKAGPFGSAGNELGIAPDPVTGDLVYVGSNGTLFEVNQALTTSKTFSTALNGKFIDGIFFDPSGNFLFASDRGGNSVAIVKRNGDLAQEVNVAPHGEPDGIFFHAVSPRFVLTNNTDGSISRIDFQNNDATKTATVTTFADGGFRGDLGQVGPDGCLYLTQDGVRFDDGTTGGENSLVRICGNFATPPGAGSTTTTTTTIKALGTTTPSTVAAAAATTTTVAAAELPRTGGSGPGMPLAGVGAVAVGAALVGFRRRPRRV